MSIESYHNPVIYGFFRLYTKIALKMHFSRIVMEGDVADENKPVLVISNHSGWWDGFWIMHMNSLLFKRKFHFMMQEEQLRKNWFFMKTGGYPVKKGSRSILESISHTVRLLGEKNNMVLMFPQGKIESGHKTTLRFEKGIGRILPAIKTPVQVLFVACFTDYWSFKKPSVFIFLRNYKGTGEYPGIESAYNSFYTESLNTYLVRDLS